MSKLLERDENVRNFLKEKEIATLDEIKTASRCGSRMTVVRSLKRLNYLVSYSDRGRFYTLSEVPWFDDRGLWICRGVMFSQHGDLFATAQEFVDRSDAGYTAAELELVLQVEVKHALLELVRRGKLSRVKIGASFVYVAAHKKVQCKQKLMRTECEARREIGAGLQTEIIPEELRAAIVLFYSILDERQRRLYAGLEAAKIGHGGDRMIADLLGLTPQTVATGRREIFGAEVEPGSVRRAGAGRKKVEKKRRR